MVVRPQALDFSALSTIHTFFRQQPFVALQPE
jgi:hypothetical protein